MSKATAQHAAPCQGCQQHLLLKCTKCAGPCGNQGANNSECVDRQWSNACCTSGYYCARAQQWSWSCQRIQEQSQSLAGTVVDYAQCGGLGGCTALQCADAPWVNTTCRPGFACVEWDK